MMIIINTGTIWEYCGILISDGNSILMDSPNLLMEMTRNWECHPQQIGIAWGILEEFVEA
jgi:hypothetical protein